MAILDNDGNLLDRISISEIRSGTKKSNELIKMGVKLAIR